MRGSTHGEKRPPDFQEPESIKRFEPKRAAFIIQRTQNDGHQTPLVGGSKQGNSGN
jgi:hypothetical protein